MTKLNTLETFRTKEELVNYFEKIGQSITEEEIDALKKSYEQTEKNDSALSLQQLDDVAGGNGPKGIYATAWEIRIKFNPNNGIQTEFLKKFSIDGQNSVLIDLSKDRLFMPKLTLEHIDNLLCNNILPPEDFIKALVPKVKASVERRYSALNSITIQRGKSGRFFYALIEIITHTEELDKLEIGSDFSYDHLLFLTPEAIRTKIFGEPKLNVEPQENTDVPY